MKIFVSISLTILSMLDARSQSGTDLWNIRFYTIDSFQVSMKDYKGETLLIATIDASKPNRVHLARLDSINRAPNGNVAVIGILIDHSGQPQKKDSLLKIIRKGPGLSYPIAPAIKWKQGENKQSGNPIISWLKESPGNKHFRIQLKEEEQIFLVNEKGILFAVLSGSSLNSPDKLNLVLNKKNGE